MKYTKYMTQILPAVALAVMAAFGFQQSKPILEAIDWTTAAAAEGDVAQEQMKKAQKAKGDYKDGVYEGTGIGYKGEVRVQVTVEDAQITDVSVLSHSDDASFFQRATALIDVIVEKQTWEVDSVSGATYSSRGIKEAVENALTGAESASAVAASANSSGGSIYESSYTGSGNWKDGTYTGRGIGFAGGTITVQVIIADAKISSISVLSATNQDEPYLSKAKAMIDKMIRAQSPNVDTISGATYSSIGIKNAVIDALNQASGGAAQTEDKLVDNRKNNTHVPTGKTLQGSYNNGSYTGVGTGWGGEISVRVTIKNNQMTALKIVRAENETPSFLNQAKAILNSILSEQSTSVDVITGATYSSKGILEAVKDALDQAKKTTEEPDDVEKPDDSQEENADGSIENNDRRNGTYTGTATVYPDSEEEFVAYTLSVDVTFEDGKTTAISEPVISDASMKSWCIMAYNGIAPLLLNSQSTETIDVVSGATCSSKALIAAYQDACRKADKDAEKMEEVQPDDDRENDENGEEDAEKPEEGENDSTAPDEIPQKRNGTYTASATVFPDEDEEFEAYTLSLMVTFQDEETKAISGLNYTDSSMAAWCNKAYDGVVSQILSTQSADVDTVSGATCSSRAIIAAYQSACAQADADLEGER